MLKDGCAMQQQVPSYEVHYHGRPAEVVEVSVRLEKAQAISGSTSEQVSVQVQLDQVARPCTCLLHCCKFGCLLLARSTVSCHCHNNTTLSYSRGFLVWPAGHCASSWCCSAGAEAPIWC